jgi:transcriptional regulator with XRE-family HTH domain
MEDAPNIIQDALTLDQLVGAAVKNDRVLAGLKLAELSAKSGVSTAMISKIERGQVSASLSTLNALAEAVGVPIINFFANTVTRSDVSFVKAGEGMNVRRTGSSFGHNYKLVGRAGSKHISFESFAVTLEKPLNARPFYQHRGIEFVHVVEGSMIFRCGEGAYEMEPGDSLSFEASNPHGTIEITSDRVTFVSLIANARMDDGNLS